MAMLRYLALCLLHALIAQNDRIKLCYSHRYWGINIYGYSPLFPPCWWCLSESTPFGLKIISSLFGFCLQDISFLFRVNRIWIWIWSSYPSPSCMTFYCIVGQCSGSEKEFRVQKLTENAVYRFRVCAHTLDGNSKWAELDKDVKACDPYGELICRSVLGYLSILMFKVAFSLSSSITQSSCSTHDSIPMMWEDNSYVNMPFWCFNHELLYG